MFRITFVFFSFLFLFLSEHINEFKREFVIRGWILLCLVLKT